MTILPPYEKRLRGPEWGSQIALGVLSTKEAMKMKELLQHIGRELSLATSMTERFLEQDGRRTARVAYMEGRADALKSIYDALRTSCRKKGGNDRDLIEKS